MIHFYIELRAKSKYEIILFELIHPWVCILDVFFIIIIILCSRDLSTAGVTYSV